MSSQIWPIVPYGAFTLATPTIPKFYWDVYSQEQRWKTICCEIQKISEYTNLLVNAINDLKLNKASKKELESAIKDFNSQIAYLKKMIEQLSLGSLQWDVQKGEYKDTVEAQRDMFNDVTVHSMTISEFNKLDLTVETLANCGLNCRGLAVMSYWLTDQFDISDIYKANGAVSEGKFTTKFLSNASVNANGFVYVPKEVQNG